MLLDGVLIFIGSPKNVTNFRLSHYFHENIHYEKKKIYIENKTIHPNRHIRKSNLIIFFNLFEAFRHDKPWRGFYFVICYSSKKFVIAIKSCNIWKKKMWEMQLIQFSVSVKRGNCVCFLVISRVLIMSYYVIIVSLCNKVASLCNACPSLW